MLAKRVVLCVLVPVVLAGCDRVENLESRNRWIELELKTLQSEVALLKIQASQPPYSSAEFDPASEIGYQRVDTHAGMFLVALNEVKPHLDGVRVQLTIGNPQLANYVGFEVKAEYSSRVPQLNRNVSAEEQSNALKAYAATQRQKTERLNQTLQAGTWNTVFINLPGIKSDVFGRLQISLKSGQISLRDQR